MGTKVGRKKERKKERLIAMVRYWQAIESYRWITGNFSKSFGFVLSVIGTRTNAFIQNGKDQIIHTENVSLVSRYKNETGGEEGTFVFLPLLTSY